MRRKTVAIHEAGAPEESAASSNPNQPVAIPPEYCRDESSLDEALADSFPASDPPAWNPGVARPIPGPPRQGG
jgi:hypothetical protein